MKACLGDEGCGGTGRLFAAPKSWIWCILCKGTGFVEGAPIGPAEIRMPNLGSIGSPTHTFSLSDFAEVKNPLMAHVMAKAGIFPSVGQARKNGWDKPLAVGEWTVTKKKIRIIVEESDNMTDDQEDVGNGIACPSCGEPLHDVDNNWQETGYECRSCDYKGFGS